MSSCKQRGSTEPTDIGSFSIRNELSSLPLLRNSRARQKGAVCLPGMLLTLIYYTACGSRLIFQIIQINGGVVPQLGYKIC